MKPKRRRPFKIVMDGRISAGGGKMPVMDEEIKSVLGGMKILDEICDMVRLVDPVLKKSGSYHNGKNIMPDVSCFDFWKKNRVCDNCISIRAYHENKTYLKMEYNGSNVYMVTAIPVMLEDRRVVIELLKDATDSFSLDLTAGGGQYAKLNRLVDSMNRLVSRDFLTGLYNRRYIDEKLPVDLINCALLSQDLSVIMADIDFFKNVNDTYGHIAGDCVLKTFAAALAGCVRRESDWIARFGGEEFLVCLPGLDLPGAKKIAETMRKAVEEKVFECAQANVKITASFGVYGAKANEAVNTGTFIQSADEMLYRAKKNGRNRVESYGGD